MDGEAGEEGLDLVVMVSGRFGMGWCGNGLWLGKFMNVGTRQEIGRRRWSAE
jgi:hypothetical protein